MGRRISKRLGWAPFADPFYTTFAFVARAGAPLSPASREFLDLARDRLHALAQALQTEPPRQRMPG
jgi:ABC-type sulfate transport system substrate-binding protein